MELSLVVSRTVGWMYLIICLTILIRPKTYLQVLGRFRQDPDSFTLFWYFLVLPFGLFIVQTHNIWAFSPDVLVTLIGWSAIIKSILYMLFPGAFLKWIPSDEAVKKWLYVVAPIFAALCAWVLWHSCGCR